MLELLIGRKGALKLSLSNMPNLSKAAGMASSVWSFGNALVVSLYKYPFASTPRGYRKSQVWVRLVAFSRNMRT